MMSKQKSLFYIFLEYAIALLVGLYVLYYHMDGVPLFLAIVYIDVVMTTIIFVFSVVHDNSSVYDPYWSVIPPVLFLVGMIQTESFDLYTSLILTGILVWAIRLTTNWLRDYQNLSHEDFRYVEFREQFKQFYWIISFLGVHLFPTLIVVLAMHPLFYVFENALWNPVFIIIGVVTMVLAAFLSFVADEQVRTFKKNPQNKKRSLDTGVWGLSRHPNYLGELMFWFGAMVISFSYGFSVLNILGFIGMCILFNLYSIPKMEERQLNRKDNYEDVIKNVPRLLPFNIMKRKK